MPRSKSRAFRGGGALAFISHLQSGSITLFPAGLRLPAASPDLLASCHGRGALRCRGSLEPESQYGLGVAFSVGSSHASTSRRLPPSQHDALGGEHELPSSSPRVDLQPAVYHGFLSRVFHRRRVSLAALSRRELSAVSRPISCLGSKHRPSHRALARHAYHALRSTPLCKTSAL